jgi:hypothetical protein
VVWGARWALALAAAVAVMTAADGAGAEVRPIGLNGCSWDCNSNAIDDLTGAWDSTDPKVSFSLCGGTTAGALLFDPDAVPKVLASGLPSALSPDPGRKSGAQIGSSYVGFEYVFTHPEEVGGPALFLSVASLTGRLTLGDILADSNAYFAAQSQALSLGRSPIGLDLSVSPSPSAATDARVSTGNSEASPKKATRPAWLDWSLPLSQ